MVRRRRKQHTQKKQREYREKARGQMAWWLPPDLTTSLRLQRNGEAEFLAMLRETNALRQPYGRQRVRGATAIIPGLTRYGDDDADGDADWRWNMGTCKNPSRRIEKYKTKHYPKKKKKGRQIGNPAREPSRLGLFSPSRDWIRGDRGLEKANKVVTLFSAAGCTAEKATGSRFAYRVH